jgi:hypothetical protein
MPDVAAFSIVRQGDRKKAIPARQNAVAMEPALPKSSSSAKIAASSTLALTPLERIFNRRWLNYFGEHAILPKEKVKSTAKATDSANPDAESIFAKLHTNLHAAWSLRDAHKLEAVASKHLMQQATSGIPVIDPFTRTLYEFFKARGCEGTGAEIIALVGGITTQQINDYLTSSAQLVSRLKAQAFAAMVNGTLSQQGIDLLLAIKSIGAFQLVAAAILKYGKEPSKIPVKMICAMLDADICFPEWTFDVDPCRWPKAGDVVPNPRGDTGVIQTWPGSATAVDAAAQASAMAASPMRQRLDREAKVIEQRSAAAAAQTAATSVQRTNPPPKPNLSDPCDCSGDLEPPCLPPDPCCAKINYYVTDTLVLRDKVKRYVPSDLAYIENVVIGENRTREHSFAKTIEDYTEEEVTTTKSEERDHQVTERFSVQNEIEKNLKVSADLHAEYGKEGTYFISADASISSETAQKEAREQFREAVDKAVSKLQVETRKLTSRRVTTREEEKNVHSFNNEHGKSHVVAKYFYVSKEVEGQVYSHGLRTTVELLIPSPSALYECLEERRMMADFKAPCVPDVVTVSEINPEHYLDFYKSYCFPPNPKNSETPKPEPELPPIIQPPKPLEVTYSDVEIFGEDTGHNAGDNTFAFGDVSIPPGYSHAIKYEIRQPFWAEQDKGFGDTKAEYYIAVALGNGNTGTAIFFTENDAFNSEKSTMTSPISQGNGLTLTVTTDNTEKFSGTVRIYWEPLPVDLGPWKQEIADTVNLANANSIIGKAKADYIAKYKENQKGRHPFINKEIILSELKRAAIYMMCEDFERGGVMNMKSKPCGYPEINRKAASEETWEWYFWERAFDWKLMSFVFFDYFWNRMCDWPEKFQPGHDDFMFNAFLRSGMARIMVPVSPGMEADIIFYLNTGQKWGLGGQPPVNPSDPRWVSVVEELKHQRDCYQNDREGTITPSIDAASSNTLGVIVMESTVLLKGSDRYWDSFASTENFTAINNDVGREIYIDGLQYRIVGIEPSTNPPSPTYDPTSSEQTMWWKITLNRPFEFDGQNDLTLTSTIPDFAYAIGAEFIGAPFRWQEPTNLVWLDGNPNSCLPKYPVNC